MPAGTVLKITAVTIGIAAGVMYSDEWRDGEKTDKETEVIKKTVQKNVSQSGELIVFRW